MARRIRMAVAVAVAAAGLCAPAASAQVSPEAHLLSLVNAARAAAALSPLAADETLASVARAQTARMVAAGTIFHNPNLKTDVPGSWRLLGENVGVGPGPDALHAAFMASQHHRENVLGAYDRVGLAFGEGGGMLYVTEVFMQSASAPRVTPKPVAPAPAAVKAAVVRPLSVVRPLAASRPTPAPTPAPEPVYIPRGPLIWRF